MKHEWIITVFMLMMAGRAWAEELPKPPSCPLYTGGKASQQQGAVAAQDTQSQVQSSENIAQSQISSWRDILQRSFIALFGLVLLAGAVYYFASSSRQQPLPRLHKEHNIMNAQKPNLGHSSSGHGMTIALVIGGILVLLLSGAGSAIVNALTSYWNSAAACVQHYDRQSVE